MYRKGLAAFAGILALNATSLQAAPRISEFREMPAKQVWEYCAPLWKKWDGIAELDSVESEDAAMRCFYVFGSVVMGFCTGTGFDGHAPIKRLVLDWKGFIESDTKVADGEFEPSLIGALVGSKICTKPATKKKARRS